MLLGYLIAEVACVAIFLFGRWLRGHPEKFARLFPIMPRFAATYARVVGAFFVVMSAIGVVFYLVLAILLLVKGDGWRS